MLHQRLQLKNVCEVERVVKVDAAFCYGESDNPAASAKLESVRNPIISHCRPITLAASCPAPPKSLKQNKQAMITDDGIMTYILAGCSLPRW